jgi:hypothetical protein
LCCPPRACVDPLEIKHHNIAHQMLSILNSIGGKMDYDIQAKTAMVVHSLTGMYNTLTPYNILLVVFDLSFSLAKILMKLYLKLSSSD